MEEERKNKILKRYQSHGQEHVFQHWEKISPDQRSMLLDQLESIPVENLDQYVKAATDESNTEDDIIKPFSGTIGKSPESENSSTSAENVQEDDDIDQNYNIGIDAIRQNKVAAVLLAGGQGSRLGFDGPKGMYDLNLQTTGITTLFALIASRIVKLQSLAAADGDETATSKNGQIPTQNNSSNIRIPLYVMTSPMNHDITMQYFRDNNNFGIEPENIKFFPQGVLPCLTLPSGKIILQSPYQCAMAPDGNGGIYPAMAKSGVIADMQQRGIEFIHAFSVDNALVKPADPGFIGYCIRMKADCGNKSLWKTDPHEKVGVVAEKGGKPCVVEYSELSKEMAERRMVTSAGENSTQAPLAFGAANICNHYYTLQFLQEQVLPNLGNMYHIARKKIPSWDNDLKQTATPTSNNGMKLESFIFDVFPLSTSMAVYQVERMYEFAPVKNASGSPSDSPDTARAMISELAKVWLAKAGAIVKVGNAGDLCEISPLTSYAGEGLDQHKGVEINFPFVLNL